MNWQAFGLSLQLAGATLLALLPVGLIVGRWLATTRSRSRVIVEALVMLPLVLPPTVLGFYLLLAFSPQSTLGQWLLNTFDLSLVFNFTGLLLASMVFNLPFMIQPIQRAFEAVPNSLVEAAYVSGLSRWQTYRQVELPLAWQGLASAVVLTFVHTLGEFGVVLMIGGSIPGQTQTLAIAIYDNVQSFEMEKANAMSLALLGFSLLAVALTFLISGRRRVKR